jgi:hypothetical protein
MRSRDDTSEDVEVDGLVALVESSDIREGVGIGSGECDIGRRGMRIGSHHPGMISNEQRCALK